MAAFLRLFGREQRHGNGAYSLGRRRADPEIAARRLVVARVDEVERRLAGYQRVRLHR